GHHVAVAGREGRAFFSSICGLGVPFHASPAEGPLKLRFIFRAAKMIRRERVWIMRGHPGRDIWPTILAPRPSRARPIALRSGAFRCRGGKDSGNSCKPPLAFMFRVPKLAS